MITQDNDQDLPPPPYNLTLMKVFNIFTGLMKQLISQPDLDEGDQKLQTAAQICGIHPQPPCGPELSIVV